MAKELDFVCAVWDAGERRWICAAVSRVVERVQAVGFAVLIASGHARMLVVPADDVEAAEAAAAALPPPEETVVDVIVEAIRSGRTVRVDCDA